MKKYQYSIWTSFSLVLVSLIIYILCLQALKHIETPHTPPTNSMYWRWTTGPPNLSWRPCVRRRWSPVALTLSAVKFWGSMLKPKSHCHPTKKCWQNNYQFTCQKLAGHNHAAKNWCKIVQPSDAGKKLISQFEIRPPWGWQKHAPAIGFSKAAGLLVCSDMLQLSNLHCVHFYPSIILYISILYVLY